MTPCVAWSCLTTLAVFFFSDCILFLFSTKAELWRREGEGEKEGQTDGQTDTQTETQRQKLIKDTHADTDRQRQTQIQRERNEANSCTCTQREFIGRKKRGERRKNKTKWRHQRKWRTQTNRDWDRQGDQAQSVRVLIIYKLCNMYDSFWSGVINMPTGSQ